VAKQKRISYGSIVWAEVNDPVDSTPAGEHPVIVLSSNEDIAAGKDLRAVVISRSYTRPLNDGWYMMDHTPGKPGGHDKTGLSEACVAKSTWPQRISQSAIRIKGNHRAPAKIVRQIRDWLQSKKVAKKTEPPSKA
jgi:hypothetical protein